MKNRSYLKIGTLPALFLAGRLILLVALPVEGLRGFGDFVHFYRLAGMGIPFVDYWVEFPPIFPFFSSLLFRIAGSREHIYDNLLVLTLTIAQGISLGIYIRLGKKIQSFDQANKRALLYFCILLVLSYGWWYFDPFAELAMILATYWLIEGKDIRAGVAIGAGILIKLFPAFLLPLVWRVRSARRALAVTTISLGLVIGVYGSLYAIEPDMTAASLKSQSSKGSWETIWALVDGNMQTGNFGPENERYDPRTATLPRGNSAKISPWIVLAPFLLIGMWAYLKVRLEETRQWISFLGFTWGLFLLWSPGWSPQWVLYLIPIILLTLPEREAFLMVLVLILINLLEWPVVLSRGYTIGLWFTIPVRTLILGILSLRMLQISNNPAV